MYYQILSSETPQQLVKDIHEFLETNNTHQNWNYLGGPYSDGKYHYQALVNKTESKLKQILNG